MRHQKKTVKLGRTAEHRKALLANQVCSLIEHERIKTTLAKAKAVRPPRRANGDVREEWIFARPAHRPRGVTAEKRGKEIVRQHCAAFGRTGVAVTLES